MIFLVGLLFVAFLRAHARPPYSDLENPAIQGINKEYPHATFISYDSLENALLNDKSKSSCLHMLNGT